MKPGEGIGDDEGFQTGARVGASYPRGSSRSRSGGRGAGVQSVVEDARRSFSEISERLDLRNRIDESPWRALGVAVGAGYLLGGGLFTPLTGRLVFGAVRLGLRLAALPLVKDELSALLGSGSQQRPESQM